MVKSRDWSEETTPEHTLSGKVGVVTVTYNSGAVLQDFLRSLSQQSYQNFIVIAVDNASGDDTIEQLSSWNFSALTVIENSKNQGVAEGNNQGIRFALSAGCECVLLLNNDVVFGPETFQQLLDGLQAYGCQMTTPLIYYNDKPDVVWCAGGVFERIYGYRSMHIGDGEKDIGQFSQPRAVVYVPTCCVMIQRDVFDRIGLMDERYFVYSDDSDFMYRAMRAGLRLFLLPDAKLWHKVSSLTGGHETDFTRYYGSRGRALFLAKHLSAMSGAAWAFFYSVFYPLRSLVGKDSWYQAQLRVKGILEGYKVGRKSNEA
jgi:GT2 family glycosyltransferase